MKWFRILLLWLALSIAGALLFEVLVSEPGRVIVSAGGKIYSMRLVVFVLLWALLWFALWALAWTVSWPLRRFRRQARRAARARLTNGLQALREGRFDRAESLLSKAAELPFQEAAALHAAREAALAQDRIGAANTYLERLALSDADDAALRRAEEAFAQRQYAVVLQHLPISGDARRGNPRGLELQCRALAAQSQPLAAQDHLQAQRAAVGLQGPTLWRLETDLARQLIAECLADAVMMHWNALSPPVRDDAEVLIAFLRRRIAEGDTTTALTQIRGQLDAQWRPALLRALDTWPASKLPALSEAVEEWITRFPGEARLHLLRARCALQAGRHESARDSAQHALALQRSSEAMVLLAEIETTRGDAGEALRWCREACAESAMPKSPA